MKSLVRNILALAIVAIGLNSTEPVKANNGQTMNGRWAGTAFANPAFDFDGDGIPGRTFVLNVYDSRFAAIEGAVDSSIISFNVCAPGAFELKAFGSFIFRAHNGDGLYAEVPDSAPHLCFDPSHPSELVALSVTGGTGAFAGETGTGTLNVHDVVRIAVPAVLIDSHGEFSLNVQ